MEAPGRDDALGLTQLLAWLSRPARRVRQRMFDLSRSVADPATPPSFNPLYGGATLMPNPARSQPTAARRFSPTTAAGADPWPAFYTAIDAVPQVYRDARMFFEEVRGAVTRYLAGEAVRVLSGATLAAPSACVTRRTEAGVEQLDLIRADGVWQRFGLPELEDYVAYFNNWMRIRGTPLSLGDPARGRGIQWFFVSLKNTLLIANECLEDRGRLPGQPRLRGIIFRPEEFEDAA